LTKGEEFLWQANRFLLYWLILNLKLSDTFFDFFGYG
jgi:hypothetical protein